MKRLIFILTAVLTLVLLVSCDAPGVYKLDESLPALIDSSTQYPYTTEIRVTKESTGETLSFTDGVDHDRIRMQFEGIKSIRERDDGSLTAEYSVTFVTTDGEKTIQIVSSEDYIMDGYHYEVMRSGIDMFFFEGLFEQ